MAKLHITKGTTSKIVHCFIQDTSKADGSGLTGLLYSAITCYYMRAGASAATSSTTQTIATLGTYAGSATNTGFKLVDDTNMPGVYEVHLPNNALATGANQVVVMLKGGTNMAPVVFEIQLQDVDFNDGVHAGLTALPNAAASASGGLLTFGTGAGQINVDGSGNASSLNTNPQGYKKNAALNNFEFAMFDSTGAPKTGLSSFTSTRSIDGAAFGAGTIGAVSEVANGIYKCNLGAGDLNGDFITFCFHATGANDTLVSIRTVVS